MKISKSKRQLAQLLIEAGVTKFPEGANWAAQDKSDKTAYMHTCKPARYGNREMFSHKHSMPGSGVPLSTLVSNWHQCTISRAEFDRIVAETAPDADGWIEWNGGECPVNGDALVVCKVRTGKEFRNGKKIKAAILRWRHTGGMSDIIAYRLHKPEHTEIEYKDGVKPIDPAKGGGPSKPTLDKLLQDWRNADDYAKRKQAEADEAAAMREERWNAVQARAGEVGVTVCVRDSRDDELKLAITDWRDLQIGDEIIIDYVDDYTDWKKNLEGKTSTIVADGVRFPICATNESCPNGESWFLGAPIKIKWRFIRRP